MSKQEVLNDAATPGTSVANVDMKLEVVIIPVSDVDRAKKFYASLGWRLDADRSVVTHSAWYSSRLLVPAAQSSSA